MKKIMFLVLLFVMILVTTECSFRYVVLPDGSLEPEIVVYDTPPVYVPTYYYTPSYINYQRTWTWPWNEEDHRHRKHHK